MVEIQEKIDLEMPQDRQRTDVTLSVRVAQIEQLYRQTKGGLLGVLIVSTFVCVALWRVVPHLWLVSWLAIMLLISAARSLLTLLFWRKAPTGQSINTWARLHAIFAALSAITWGVPSFLLWPEHYPIHQLVWPICIVAISAAAVLMYSTWKPSFFSFIFLAVVPISLRMLTAGELPYIILGLLGFLFSFLLGYAGLLMYNATEKAFVVSLRNEALSKVLSEEKIMIHNLNVQLNEEIEQRKRSQEELQDKNQKLEKLNEQLAQALANVKQLSGMLPICSSCKKIRNDRGYWEQIEAYIHEHSEVKFSHGICPDCIKKLYPDYQLKEDNAMPLAEEENE